MPISRYAVINGEEISIANFVYKAVDNDLIEFKERVSEAGKRLDHYAFEEYGDALNWWIIAAASGIGWWLQVPPGTILRIPTDLSQIEAIKEILG